MKKHFIILLLSYFASITTLVAQDSITSKRVFVKLFYSPQLAYRRDIGDQTRVSGFNSGESWSNSSYDSKEEKPKYGNEFGLILEFPLSKKINLNTGTSFETQGFKTDSNIVTYDSGWGDIVGNWSDTTYNNSYNYSFYYISTPLIVNYSIKLKEEKTFYFGAGTELKYLFRSRLNNQTDYGRGIPLNLRFSVFYFINLGMSFPLEDNKCIFFEPNFKIQNKIYTMPSKDIKYQLWSAGCKIGVKF